MVTLKFVLRFPILSRFYLFKGMFSPSSDVWAFGVTVWEILTYCSVKPYEEMNDDQVSGFLDLFYSY